MNYQYKWNEWQIKSTHTIIYILIMRTQNSYNCCIISRLSSEFPRGLTEKKKKGKNKRFLFNYLIWTHYLRPGTDDTGEPSFWTHVTCGVGFPCAEHDICEPVSLLNSNLDNGSCRNNGAWPPLSSIDANITYNNSANWKCYHLFDFVCCCWKIALIK